MGWKIEFSESVNKQFKKLDPHIADKITRYLEKIATSANPKSFGKPLHADLSGYWRYRWRDYRIICEIKDKELVVLVLKVDHRRKVYD